MPVSDSNTESGPDSPYVPSWCYENNAPPMCSCGHHHGYHNDVGVCRQQHKCKCSGYDGDKPADRTTMIIEDLGRPLK